MVDILSKTFTSPSRIIVAPLNWGLGHATRSLPLIRSLINQNHTVGIASDGAALTYLRKELDLFPFWELPGHAITYPYKSMVLNMLIQAPGLMTSIAKEHKAITTIAADWNADAIISDNRFGCYHKEIRSIFISHQIRIDGGNAFLSSLATKWNQRRIAKFDECWIPDYEKEPTLAGSLSHDHNLKEVSYIGPLSRMHKIDSPKKWDIVAVLSGPEPQRSHLEKSLIREVEKLKDKKTLLVRGLVDKNSKPLMSEKITIKNFMGAQELNEAVNAAALVISRSGYSSIMDWAVLGKPAIIIPTPGQPEQEYLASLHNKTKSFRSILQSDLSNLKNLIQECI